MNNYPKSLVMIFQSFLNLNRAQQIHCKVRKAGASKVLVYCHNLIFYLLREKKYVVKHWNCNIAFIQVLKQVAHAKHLSDRFAFNQNSRTYSRCLNKFHAFQLCIMGGRQLKVIEMLETRSED